MSLDERAKKSHLAWERLLVANAMFTSVCFFLTFVLFALSKSWWALIIMVYPIIEWIRLPKKPKGEQL
jgi:hypothetical protein